MIRKEITVTNKTGLHARPASRLVKISNEFKSSIIINANEKRVNAKSILSVLSAGIAKGMSIVIQIEGEDEILAEKALFDLFDSKFGE